MKCKYLVEGTLLALFNISSPLIKTPEGNVSWDCWWTFDYKFPPKFFNFLSSFGKHINNTLAVIFEKIFLRREGHAIKRSKKKIFLRQKHAKKFTAKTRCVSSMVITRVKISHHAGHFDYILMKNKTKKDLSLAVVGKFDSRHCLLALSSLKFCHHRSSCFFLSLFDDQAIFTSILFYSVRNEKDFSTHFPHHHCCWTHIREKRVQVCGVKGII